MIQKIFLRDFLKGFSKIFSYGILRDFEISEKRKMFGHVDFTNKFSYRFAVALY